jgi:hypothetical protein
MEFLSITTIAFALSSWDFVADFALVDCPSFYVSIFHLCRQEGPAL